MNVHFPVRRSRWPGRLVQIGVIVVVAAVAAATFMLSYAGVHAVALQAGVPRDLARYYPGILDAVLVIACAAAPVLRDARWWVRCYAWLAIIVVVVVIGGVDAVHAMNVALPRRTTAGVAAVLPWALLLLAFSLWLTILRHLRAQHLARETEVADVAGVTVARKALEAAAPPVVPLTDGDGTAVEELEVVEASAAGGTKPEADATGESGAAPTTVGAQASTVHEPDHEKGKEGSPATEGVRPADARSDEEVPAKEPTAEPATEPVGEPGDTPEEIREVPAVTYATGPRLRRVRSLPAPPVDDEE
jgi:hypothetical protein